MSGAPFSGKIVDEQRVLVFEAGNGTGRRTRSPSMRHVRQSILEPLRRLTI
jgi:hypothetical protein